MTTKDLTAMLLKEVLSYDLESNHMMKKKMGLSISKTLGDNLLEVITKTNLIFPKEGLIIKSLLQLHQMPNLYQDRQFMIKVKRISHQH